jgi:hypothetical protein
VVFEYRLDELKNVITLRVACISTWGIWQRRGMAQTCTSFVKMTDVWAVAVLGPMQIVSGNSSLHAGRTNQIS